MRKIIFFLPAIIFAAFYGIIQITGLAFSISPIVYVWIALFIISGFLLINRIYWGGVLGVLPGIHLIHMSTKDTLQIIDIELLTGIIVVIFFLLCIGFSFQKNKKTASQS